MNTPNDPRYDESQQNDAPEEPTSPATQEATPPPESRADDPAGNGDEAADAGPPVDPVLARLLIADLKPNTDGDSTVDALVEPPPTQQPLMSLERRRRLLAVVGEELDARHRNDGNLSQVLFRNREAVGESAEDFAARVNEEIALVDLVVIVRPHQDQEGTFVAEAVPAHSIVESDADTTTVSRIDAETVRELETGKLDLGDHRNRAIAAVLTAVRDVRPQTARDALLWSLRPPVDGPLAAGRPKHEEASEEDVARIDEFMKIYARVRDALREAKSR